MRTIILKIRKKIQNPYFLLFAFVGFLWNLQAAVRIPLNDYNEWSIIHLAAAILPKKPVIVQAGIHHKDTMGEMRYFWPEGSLHIFEPNPNTFEELRQHNIAWHFRINVYPLALNEMSGPALFYFDRGGINPRAGSLLRAADQWKWYYKESSIVTVPCQNLKGWTDQNNIRSIDFLWLNVGGMELRILRSIPELLTAMTLIVVETHFQEFRLGTGLYSDLKKFLEEFNFEEIRHWYITQYSGFAVFAKKGLVENSS